MSGSGQLQVNCGRLARMSGDGGVFQGSVPDSYRRLLEPTIFGPWAERLLDVVGLTAGEHVLDVAAGTGVVARLAARRLGAEGGRVVASDISGAMLSHVNAEIDLDAAPIETAECSATELTFDDGTFDVVVCQQGFPFIPDRTRAAQEFCRVLRPGGRAAAAVWLLDAPLDPFETYANVLRDAGISEPFPGAFDVASFQMSEDGMAAALTDGGFHDIVVEVQEHDPPWASPLAAAEGVAGTPYGPPVSALGEPERREVLDALTRAFSSNDGSLRHRTQRAVIGRGVAPG